MTIIEALSALSGFCWFVQPLFCLYIPVEDGHPAYSRFLSSARHSSVGERSPNGEHPKLPSQKQQIAGVAAKTTANSDNAIRPLSLNAFLDTLINPEQYDKRIRPFKQRKLPCNITITVHINSISAINEVTMDFNIDLYFRQIWVDPRLRYDHTSYAKDSPLVLHYDLIDRIWVPDSYFRNAKEGKRSDITVPNRLTRIYKDGTVLYSQRLLLKLDCPMKLQKFPLDNQTCLVNIGSYGFTLDDLRFEWSKTEAPIGLSNIEMPDFLMEQFEAVKCQRKTSTGSYPCLEIKLYMKRLFGYYFVQVYIPSMLLVIMCSLSFWVDYRSAPARISMGMMNVVAIVTQSSGIRGQLPKVSYIKAIDVWMLMCLVFAFLALCEYVAVNVLAWKAERERQHIMSERHQPKKKSHRVRGDNILRRLQHSHFSCDKMVGTRLATGHGSSNRPKWSEASSAAMLPESSVDSTFNISLTAPRQQEDMGGGIGSQLMPPGPTPPRSSPFPARRRDDPSSIDAATSRGDKGLNMPRIQRGATSIAATTINMKDRAHKVDTMSAYAFPLMFVVFNLVYWLYFTNITV